MINLSFVSDYSPLLILLVSFILIYASLTKLKIPGNPFTLAVLSFLLSIIFVSSKSVVHYVFSLLPYLTIIMVISTFILITLALVAGKLENFTKPLAMIGFVVAIILILCFAFNQFTVMNHMLPNTSNSGLDKSLVEFKGWIYSREVLDTLIFIGSVLLVGFYMLKK